MVTSRGTAGYESKNTTGLALDRPAARDKKFLDELKSNAIHKLKNDTRPIDPRLVTKEFMNRIEKIEDLIIWQKVRELSKIIYQVTAEGKFSKDFGLRDQIRRSSVSVMSNIAEGFEPQGDGEFKRFLSIAKGSLGEVRSQLYVALDVGYISEQKFNELNNFCIDLSRKIGSFISYLEKSINGKKMTRDPQPRDS